MSVIWAWCGAPTSVGFRVNARISGSSARLLVADAADFSSTVVGDPVAPDTYGVVALQATGLDPDTAYWWRVEVDGTPDAAWTGQTRTHRPIGEPWSYMFAAAGDSGLGAVPSVTNGVSNRGIFDVIRQRDPLFFLHLGDIHYRNITVGGTQAYVDAYGDVLTYNGVLGAEARQAQLYRSTPIIYTWDDHDYSGNNSDGTYPGKLGASAAYRACVPHYPLADPYAVYHAFMVGRVQYAILDSRYYRTPNTEPDNPGKTMLGPGQLAWLDDLLATSTAEALIVVSPVQWMSGYEDSWGSFAHERDQLAQMLSDHGWSDRMVMLSADKHSLGIDTGSSNRWGGFPNFLFASMDSNPSSSEGPYDIGITGGRDRYGLVRVEDTGDQIAIEGIGYINTTRWRSHRKQWATRDDGDNGGEQPIPPATRAVARPRVTWLSCNLVTGAVISELPDLSGSVSRVLGQHTSSRLTLPIPPSGLAALPRTVWETATAPGRAMLVAVVNDAPTWGGIVLRRVGGTGAELDLTVASLEVYLDRRYVTDHRWILRDEARIAADLVADAQHEGIDLIVDAPNTGTLRDRTYHHDEDATVYARLTELMGVRNGPEWTIDVEWADPNRNRIVKIFRLRNRIGLAASRPDAVFDSRGPSSAIYTYREDYSGSKGANHVTATGAGEGEDRPESPPIADVRPGWPRYETRIRPSGSISRVETLTEHAQSELALRKFGGRVFELETRWDATPRLNLDWRLGDDVAWNLAGHRHPDGVYGRGRVVGWDLDMNAGIVRPILYEESEA